MRACCVCGGQGLREAAVAPERMFGMEGAFTYVECEDCGAVQLRDIPDDLQRYYPAGYYAHAQAAASTGSGSRLRGVRDAILYRASWPVGWVAALASSTPRRLSRRWFSVTGASRDAKILDVGCGQGQRLRELARAGFRRLHGVDPYIDHPFTAVSGRVQVQRGTIAEMVDEGSFDLVMFHHSLEHMAEQRPVMARAAALLRAGGWVLVRVPTVSSWAWPHYGADWVQLDAPRHLVLHSVESLRRLGAGCGLTLERVEYDSTEFQLVGSEGYRAGLTLPQATEAFSPATVREWRRLAYRLNREQRGDQAAFYFRRAPGWLPRRHREHE